MPLDKYSGEHAQTDSKAIEAFERAVWSTLAHRPDGAAALDEALSLSPDFTAAHTLRGFCGVSLARRETVAAARKNLAAARATLRRGSTSSERTLVEALDFAVAGRLRDAAARLESHLAERPRDLLALKLSHGLRFMSGETSAMLAATTAASRHWPTSMEGVGFGLGCHAFALEENGFLSKAERIGRTAVDLEASNAWGAHAVGHVYEMQNRATEGVRWLDATRPAWSGCNNFAFHMAWHLALCHMAQGRADVALALYDAHVRPTSTDDFRDVANAVSLLWRLRQEGVEAGDRWRELASIARNRADDCTLVFASLHYLLAAIAADDLAIASAIAAALAQRAHSPVADQDKVAREIGAELARAIIDGHCSGAEIVRRVARLDTLGGSRAQRDVFLRTLALIAAESGDQRELDEIMRLRGKTPGDRFERMARRRAAETDAPRQVA